MGRPQGHIKPLKVKSMPGLDIGPDELKAKQKADPTLRKYWELADKSVDGAKQQFFTKKVYYTVDIVENRIPKI